MDMPQVLSKLTYQSLISEISAIYQSARDQAQAAVNPILVKAYWEIGRRIVKVEQDNQIRAQYGTQLLENLSQDLTQKFGNGFSPVNLSYMRRFYLAYPIFQTSEKLSWSHFQVLSSIKDDKKRRFYQRRSVEQDWSIRELREALRQDRVEREPLYAGRAALAHEGETLVHLPVNRGILYLYKVDEPKTFVPIQGCTMMDCGFGIWREAPLEGLEQPVQGQMVELQTTGSGFKVVPTTKTARHLYTYKAYLERVIDGDTLKVHIDLGLHTWVKQRIRLKEIDAPELMTKKGQQAKEWVERVLAQVAFVVVKTYTSDKYDRYLADVFYLPAGKAGLPGATDANVVAQEGRLLNQELLDQGLAVRV